MTPWMMRETASEAATQYKTFQLKIVVRNHRLSS